MNACTKVRCLHHDESGMISIVAVFNVFLFVILLTFVFNIAFAVNHKIRLQNAADAVATSCGIQQARMLNAITAANHLTGELLALVILHESFGCRYQNESEEESQRSDTSVWDLKLLFRYLEFEINKLWAPELNPRSPAYKEVKEKVKVTYALLDSYRDLKDWLADIYSLKSAACLIYGIGGRIAPIAIPCQIAGRLIYAIAHGAEICIRTEWRTLKTIENKLVRSTVTTRNSIYKLPNKIRQFQQFLPKRMPIVIPQSAKGIGELHGVTVATYPGSFGLTFAEEKVSVSQITQEPWKKVNAGNRKEVAKLLQQGRQDNFDPFSRSQIVRTTYPWVNYHRQPVINNPVARAMIFSRLAEHYRDWSSYITLTRTAEYYRQSDTRLPVLPDTDPMSKGKEPWTKNSTDIDRMFALVAMVHADSPRQVAKSYNYSNNPGGTLAYAQVLVYNWNKLPQGNKRLFQPDIGWNTLNWKPADWLPAPQSLAPEWPLFSKKSKCPEVWLNWQAKLVPATRLHQASFTAISPFKQLLDKLVLDSSMTRAH